MQTSEAKALGPDGRERKRGRRPTRGVAAGLQVNLNTGAGRHAAEQYRSWVQALGGADNVSPQEATLLRHASYLATFADACWYQTCVSGSSPAAEAMAKAAQTCAALLRACGLARRSCDSSAPRLRELASLAPQASAASPTPTTSRPPASPRTGGTPLAETLACLSQVTAQQAACPGAPLALWAEPGEQPGLPGLEPPSEIASRKQYLFSSDSEQARRRRRELAQQKGIAGMKSRWGAATASAACASDEEKSTVPASFPEDQGEQ